MEIATGERGSPSEAYDWSPGEVAAGCRLLADFFDQEARQNATTFTGDDLYRALMRLRDSTGRAIQAADVIRADRP